MTSDIRADVLRLVVSQKTNQQKRKTRSIGQSIRVDRQECRGKHEEGEDTGWNERGKRRWCE